MQKKVKLLAGARHERRKAQHEQVWALHRQGWPGDKIGPPLGISRSTVYRHLRSEAFPERRTRRDAGRSRLDPWRHIVLEHWNNDRRDGRKLFGELRRLGYRGSYATLTRYLGVIARFVQNRTLAACRSGFSVDLGCVG
jgi:transposase